MPPVNRAENTRHRRRADQVTDQAFLGRDRCTLPVPHCTEVSRQSVGLGHVWTVPAVQEESEHSAKRSGAVMYSACFRLEACLCDDAATMAAGRDVIR